MIQTTTIWCYDCKKRVQAIIEYDPTDESLQNEIDPERYEWVFASAECSECGAPLPDPYPPKLQVEYPDKTNWSP